MQQIQKVAKEKQSNPFSRLKVFVEDDARKCLARKSLSFCDLRNLFARKLEELIGEDGNVRLFNIITEYLDFDKPLWKKVAIKGTGEVTAEGTTSLTPFDDPKDFSEGSEFWLYKGVKITSYPVFDSFFDPSGTKTPKEDIYYIPEQKKFIKVSRTVTKNDTVYGGRLQGMAAAYDCYTVYKITYTGAKEISKKEALSEFDFSWFTDWLDQVLGRGDE
jgi:hypothetical protein